MKIKIITGFGDDQKHSIDADEAHKAYYLFRNPEKRGVFSNGLALMGRDIRAIQPDWHGTMGWNPTHKLDDDDWNQLRGSGTVAKLNEMLGNGNLIAYKIDENPRLLHMRLSDIPALKGPPTEHSKLTEGINKLQPNTTDKPNVSEILP
jgi:hypothetical protein